MSTGTGTSDKDQPQEPGQEQGRGGASAEGGDRERRAPRHGRHGRRGGGRPPQSSSPQTQRRSESSLNIDELRELTDLFTSHGLTDFEFENADIRIRLSRNPAPQTGATTAPPAPSPAAAMHAAAANAPAAQPPAPAEPPAEAPRAEERAKEEELHLITSPIVGTFYRAPGPNAEPFVKAGSQVGPDTVVCIIEAMKLMNEIQAETTGTVEKIYVENGQPVEYGQPLFGVKK